MKIKDFLTLGFCSRPENPPSGSKEVLVYPDEQTGEMVWQDKDGVHTFGAVHWYGAEDDAIEEDPEEYPIDYE